MSLINLGAGLSAMGQSIASYAGTAGLAAQKADLENQTAVLANQLATQRDSVNQAWDTQRSKDAQAAASSLADKNIQAGLDLENQRATHTASEDALNRSATASEGAKNRASQENIYGTDDEVAGGRDTFTLPNGNVGVLMGGGDIKDTGQKATPIPTGSGIDKGWKMFEGPAGQGQYRVNENAGLVQQKAGSGWQDVDQLPGGSTHIGSNIGVKDSVRTNMVNGAATNVLRQMDGLGDNIAGLRASSEIGVHPEGYFGNVTQGIRRSFMSDDQKNADTKIAGIIDEAIPVLTGGLRSSDSFRSFLLSQVPRSLGDNDATAAAKWKVLRDNIDGTSNAFRSKFASDPKNWGPGVSPQDVQKPVATPVAPSAPASGPSIDDLLKLYGGNPQ